MDVALLAINTLDGLYWVSPEAKKIDDVQYLNLACAWILCNSDNRAGKP